jgi:hypothetical protein
MGWPCDTLDMGYDPLGPHTFSRAVWRLVVTFATEEQLQCMGADACQVVLDLVAH